MGRTPPYLHRTDNNQPVSRSAIGEANCPGGEDEAGNEAIPLGVLTWSDSSDGDNEPSAGALQSRQEYWVSWLTGYHPLGSLLLLCILLHCSSPAFRSGTRSDPERTGVVDMTDMTRSGRSHACPVWERDGWEGCRSWCC